jgi:hypothetical protein
MSFRHGAALVRVVRLRNRYDFLRHVRTIPLRPRGLLQPSRTYARPTPGRIPICLAPPAGGPGTVNLPFSRVFTVYKKRGAFAGTSRSRIRSGVPLDKQPFSLQPACRQPTWAQSPRGDSAFDRWKSSHRERVNSSRNRGLRDQNCAKSGEKDRKILGEVLAVSVDSRRSPSTMRRMEPAAVLCRVSAASLICTQNCVLLYRAAVHGAEGVRGCF